MQYITMELCSAQFHRNINIASLFLFKQHNMLLKTRDVEAAISSTASTPIASASASNRTWTLTEPGLYLIYELADKHDYQNQQLTIYKGTLRFTRA